MGTLREAISVNRGIDKIYRLAGRRRRRRDLAVGSPLPSKAPLATKAAWRRAGAVGCLLGIVVTWISMAEVVQGMESSFPKPYFLRLIVNGSYSVCLVAWAAWRFCPVKGKQRRQGVEIPPGEEEGETEALRHLQISSPDISPPKPVDVKKDRISKPTDRQPPLSIGDGNSDVRGIQLAEMNGASIERSYQSNLMTALEQKKRHIEERYDSASNERFNYLGYFNWCYFFGASIILAMLSFLSGWLWYISLPMTSVSGNSAIYQSMCTMVYVFSIVCLKERVTFLKTSAVCISVVGVLLVSFFGSHNESSPEPDALPISLRMLMGASVDTIASEEPHNSNPSFLGYLMCTVSMILYSLYEVLYKKWGSHSADPVPLMNAVRFLGLVGISSLVFCSPFLLLLDITGTEKFEAPSGEEWRLLAIVGFLDTVFNLLLLFAIMLSSPLFTSVGCLLVLPASVLWDFWAHDYELPFWGTMATIAKLLAHLCLVCCLSFTSLCIDYSSDRCRFYCVWVWWLCDRRVQGDDL